MAKRKKRTQTTFIPVTPKKDYWESKEIEYLTACSLAKKPRVFITPYAVARIKAMLDAFPSTEWGADLLGRHEDDIYLIEDIYIFEQEVTTTHITRKEDPHPDAIGVTHSHHHMGAFFSHTDDTYANENHDLSGVISTEPHNGLPFKMIFTARVKTPCGKYIRYDDIETEVFYSLPDVKVEETEKGKVKEKVYSYSPSKYNWYDRWIY